MIILLYGLCAFQIKKKKVKKKKENTSGIIYPRALYSSYPLLKYLHQLQINRLFLAEPQSARTSNMIVHDKNKNRDISEDIF